MQFQLTMSLDNADAQDFPGPVTAAARYLVDVSEALYNVGEPSGTVRDGNGNTIGQWTITDQG